MNYAGVTLLLSFPVLSETKPNQYRSPTFADLERIGISVTSPEEFLLRLKTERIVLPYRIEIIDSGSKQEGSLQSPREARFIPIGKEHPNDEAIIITYNNDSGQRGFSAIEIMQTGKNFKLKEYNYAHGKVQTDTQSCTACHGADPTGRWKVWASWPTILCGGAKQEMGSTKTCEDEYARIRKTGRYSFLPDASDLKSEMPANKDFAEITPRSQILLFDEIMNRSNAQRLARKIKDLIQKNSNLENFKYAMIGVSLCNSTTTLNQFVTSLSKGSTSDFDKWIPPSTVSFFARKGFATYQQVRAETKQFHSKNENGKQSFSPKEVLLDTNRTAAFRYIFSLQKIDIQDWNMEGLQYAHSDFSGDLALLWKPLYPMLLSSKKEDQELAKDLDHLNQENHSKICEKLSKLNSFALKKFSLEGGICTECNK